VGDLVDVPFDSALPKIETILMKALGDKRLAFQGETTVMKFIGG
jgi:cyclic pyranopterin phosphate synthase